MASSYKPILQQISQSVRDGGLVLLNTTVESITSIIRDGEKIVSISTKDGQKHEADAVIVTTPLGCLKRKAIKFDPELPERIQRAIQALGYGNLEKAYITFPSAWWESATDMESFFFSSPSYAADTNPGRFPVHAFVLSHLPGPNRHPTLLFYFYGSLSKALTSQDRSSTSELVSFLQPYYSRIPGYDPSSPECQPAAATRTDWSNDPLAGFGSYSNFPTGLTHGVEDIGVIRAGIEDEHVWFAGEHVAPLVGLGTVTGAYWSGEICAKRVLRVLGVTSEDESAGEVERLESIFTPKEKSEYETREERSMVRKLLAIFAPGAPFPEGTGGSEVGCDMEGYEGRGEENAVAASA